MHTILVPLDGSILAEQALSTARLVAEAIDGEIELVQVLERTAGGATVTEAGQYLRAIARRLGDRVPVTVRVLRGAPVDELLRASAETAGRLLVMSTHGRGGVERLIFGSVTDRLVRNSTVPIIVVREAPAGRPGQLRHLMVPLDGSELAEGALNVALDLAVAGGATLGLVRVVEVYPASAYGIGVEEVPPDEELLAELTEQGRDDARLYLDEVVRRARDRGVRVAWEVRVGRPADEIVRAAETTAADLIVMSTHGRGGMRRWAFGSVTDDVLRAAGAPVLVLPPRYAGPAGGSRTLASLARG